MRFISLSAYICEVIAILTGDIVNSASVDAPQWLNRLKSFLNKVGNTPQDWEIYRGDSFQLRCIPQNSFRLYVLLKSIIRQISGLDVRVSIGIGEIDYEAARLSESNGSAFIRSGRTFDEMKEKQYLAFGTGTAEFDKTLNLFARFASLIMDNWSVSVAETVQIILEHPDWNQQQIAGQLKINQSAVSQNRKRAQLDLILEFNDYFVSAMDKSGL